MQLASLKKKTKSLYRYFKWKVIIWLEVFNSDEYLINDYRHIIIYYNLLTQWGRVTHICVGNLTIIGPDNGLLPGRRQAIFWTNAGILLIGPLGTNFSEIFILI